MPLCCGQVFREASGVALREHTDERGARTLETTIDRGRALCYTQKRYGRPGSPVGAVRFTLPAFR